MLGEAAGDALATAYACRIHEHTSGPAVHVELGKKSPHGAHALALLIGRHANGRLHRGTGLVNIVGIDDQSFRQFPCRLGELAEN